MTVVHMCLSIQSYRHHLLRHLIPLCRLHCLERFGFALVLGCDVDFMLFEIFRGPTLSRGSVTLVFLATGLLVLVAPSDSSSSIVVLIKFQKAFPTGAKCSTDLFSFSGAFLFPLREGLEESSSSSVPSSVPSSLPIES